MYLSYSGHKAYKECPRQYWHRYIDKTKLPTPDNKVNSLYGSVVGTLFEAFYNEQLYLQRGVADTLLDRVDLVIDTVIERECESGQVDWSDPKSNYKSRTALRADVVETIPRGLDIIRHHRLLSRESEAEVKLDQTIGGHTIGGRADFIMRRTKPHEDLLILDGKGSKWREKYVDPQQLWWYAMLYRSKHQRMPDKLGFVFWRQAPVTSLDWVAVNEKDLDDLQAGVLDSIAHIEHGKEVLPKGPVQDFSLLQQTFPAQLGDKCNLCSYREVCPEGKSFTARRFQSAEHEDWGI